MRQALRGRARFGSFELDVRAGELHSNGQATVLQEQQLKVLLILIECDGEIATRDEIKKKLWPNDTVVEFDHGINQAIKNLRRLLGDSAQNSRYIETIARRGYRLMAPVEWVGAESVVADSGEESSVQSSSISISDSSVSSDSEIHPNTRLKVGRLNGKIVSHYRVLEVIGGGGMGLVYRAEDLKLGRAVALKFLPEEVGDDPRALERFEREAKAVSALNHFNICTVYDFDEYEGHPFIAMELLQGKTLRDHLAHGRFRLTKPEGIEVAIQIASGLEAAHERGIVHRDIKPANIFITDKNVAKILDFGVAKVMQVDASESHSNNGRLSGAPGLVSGVSPAQFVGADSFGAPQGAPLQNSGADGAPEGAPLQNHISLTRTGMQLGTAGYMSPEQIRGEPLDARSDIFSFGLVLYEMATGERAFTGETEAILHDAIQHQHPNPVRLLAPEISPNLQSVVSTCLEKDRARRYQTVGEVRAALSEALPQSIYVDVTRASPKTKRSHRWRWVATGCIAVILTVVVAGIVYRRTHPTPQLADNDTIILGEFENRTSDPIFNNTFTPALEVAFGQTPFLNPLSSEKVSQVLKSMNKPTDERVTPVVAREVCARTNSTAYVTGSISDAGNQYRLELRAVNCETGSTLASASANVEERNQIIATLGGVSYTLREGLGEPKPSLQEFNMPLAQATTASLEALQAFVKGDAAGASPQSIAELKRAVEADPEFALAYDLAGVRYSNLGRDRLASENIAKAYQLRERRLSRRNRLFIEALYYMYMTGEYEKAILANEQVIQEFPRFGRPRLILGLLLFRLGEYERALSARRDALRLIPETAATYSGLAESYLAQNRLEDAKLVLDQAVARHFVTWPVVRTQYRLAFLQNDQAGMEEQVRWASSKPELTDLILGEQYETQAYYGHLHKADELSRKAVEAAAKAGTDRGAGLRAAHALQLAETGEIAHSRELAVQSMTHNYEAGAKIAAAQVFATVGDTSRALDLSREVDQEWPVNTLVQGCSLPAIRAQIEMQQGKPESAIGTLERGVARQFPKACGIGWAYLRATAYMKAGREREAATQFTDIVAHLGIAVNGLGNLRPYSNSGNPLIVALARLQLARAQAMMGDTDAARKSYQEFLTLWKDADPDIPIYKQANAEYAKLVRSSQLSAVSHR